MFNKKLSNADRAEIKDFVINYVKGEIKASDLRMLELARAIDFNGFVHGNVLRHLLEKFGLTFYRETEPMTPKEIKSLGKHCRFAVSGVNFVIAKKSVVEKKTPKTKKTKKTKKVKKTSKK